MAQAIFVKYLGPTNTKGGRLKASAWFGTVTVGYDHAQGPSQNYEGVAFALCKKYGYNNVQLEGAHLPNGKGYAFIMKPAYP